MAAGRGRRLGAEEEAAGEAAATDGCGARGWIAPDGQRTTTAQRGRATAARRQAVRATAARGRRCGGRGLAGQRLEATRRDWPEERAATAWVGCRCCCVGCCDELLLWIS